MCSANARSYLKEVRCVQYGNVQVSRTVCVNAVARIDLRLSFKDREHLARPAALGGLPRAAFVRTAVLREADRSVAAESVARRSVAESKRFLVSIRRPIAPNAALRRALKRGEDEGT